MISKTDKNLKWVYIYTYKFFYLCKYSKTSPKLYALVITIGFSKRRLLKNGAVPTLYKDNVEQEIDEATKLENKRIVDELLKQYDADLTKAGMQFRFKDNFRNLPK